MPLAEGLGDAPVTLVLNPASRAAVEALLEQATGLPVIIEEEPTLGEGQVYSNWAGRGPDRPRQGLADICRRRARLLRASRKGSTPWMDQCCRQQPLRPGARSRSPFRSARPARWCATCCGCSRDAVLALDRRVEDPVELYVGDRLIARGELQELEGEQAGQLAVRLTEVANLRGRAVTAPTCPCCA